MACHVPTIVFDFHSIFAVSINNKETRVKAIRFHEYGGPEVLRFEEAPDPQAGPGQLLIRVHAAGVNPVDWKLREGRLQGAVDLTLPIIPGGDVAAGGVGGTG